MVLEPALEELSYDLARRLDSALGKREIGAEERSGIIDLAMKVDARSFALYGRRYTAAWDVAEKMDIGIAKGEGRPKTETFSRSLLYLHQGGLSDSKIKMVVIKFPQIVGLSEENIELKLRFYWSRFGISRAEFIDPDTLDQMIMGSSLYDKIFPRVVYYKRQAGRNPTKEELRNMFYLSEEKFLKKLEIKGLEVNIGGYRRAQELCQLLRKSGRDAVSERRRVS